MKFSIHFHDQIEDQISEIFFWYEEQQPGLGNYFLQEFNRTIIDIAEYPGGIQIKRKKFRVVKINKFPYVIVFELNGKKIDVFSVTHTSRHFKKRFRSK
jgi:toxin ParE1/3/4